MAVVDHTFRCFGVTDRIHFCFWLRFQGTCNNEGLLLHGPSLDVRKVT